MYSEDELLMISGIQHFSYCKRQWALIHVENQWERNVYTVRGDIVHEKVDDPFILETRGDLIVSRSVPIISWELGFYGIADLIEFNKSETGVVIQGKEGYFNILPVEYKVGKPKESLYDEIQLCLQALCLEEMYGTKIEEGAMYYAKIRRRMKVHFDSRLRKYTTDIAAEMHKLISENVTPKENYGSKCDHCSLYNICLPKIMSKRKSVSAYIRECIEDIEVVE